MDKREKQRQILLVLSRIFLILGGILLGIVGLYASQIYRSPNRVRTSGGNYIAAAYNLFQNILEMSRYEPLGGILAAVSAASLLIGIVLYLAGRHLK